MRSKISEYHVSNVIDEFELRALSVSSSLLEDAVRSVLVVFLASLAAALLSRLMRRIEQKMTSKRSDPDSLRRVATAYRAGLIFGRIVILLCHLNFGPFRVRVFRRKYPWLGEELRHEGIEVHGCAEGVRYQAG